MDSSWYDTLAKKGFLGTKAKMSADTNRADWSAKKDEKPIDQTEAMKRRQAKLGTGA